MKTVKSSIGALVAVPFASEPICPAVYPDQCDRFIQGTYLRSVEPDHMGKSVVTRSTTASAFANVCFAISRGQA